MLTQHIRKSLQITPGPFPDFWAGPGDEATTLDLTISLVLITLELEPRIGAPDHFW